ncbi:hypothetical protein D3C86_1451050 [compost metagenome]
MLCIVRIEFDGDYVIQDSIGSESDVFIFPSFTTIFRMVNFFRGHSETDSGSSIDFVGICWIEFQSTQNTSR